MSLRYIDPIPPRLQRLRSMSDAAKRAYGSGASASITTWRALRPMVLTYEEASSLINDRGVVVPCDGGYFLHGSKRLDPSFARLLMRYGVPTG